jgi:hypothetical protein
MQGAKTATRRAFSAAMAAAIGVAASGLGRAARAEVAPDSLVRVRRKNLSAAWLLPGADLRSYTKLRVEPGAVSYHSSWYREMSKAPMPIAERTRAEEAAFILADIQRAFEASFPTAVKVAGLEAAQASELSALLLKAGVVELWVAVPPRATDRSNFNRSAERAGRGVLEAELSDGPTGQVLARFRDRRETPLGYAAKGLVTRELNEREFGLLFQRWAELMAAEIAELRALSPLPARLEENQRFPG